MTTVLTVGTRMRLDACEESLLHAFGAQRRRTLETARALPASAWSRPTRCTEWDAHDLLVHLLGATEVCGTTLRGTLPVFEGDFDPNSTPNRFVERRRGEPVARTLADLEASIEDAEAALSGVDPSAEVRAVWGDLVDWRLFALHLFWDGWLHERDLLVPHGGDLVADDREVRFAAAYSLVVAGVMASMLGTPLDLAVDLGGPGSGTYRVVGEQGDVTVTVSPARGGHAGSAAVVADSLTGRGPDLDEVLDAPAEVVEPLSLLSGFLRGE